MDKSSKKFDAYSQNCPARLFFDHLADKWVLLILSVLTQQPTHFNALKKQIEGISPKVLSQKLKLLVRNGFLKRQILDTSPIRVEYHLTELGVDMAKMALNLKLWAEQNMSQVLLSQNQYDQQHDVLNPDEN